MVKEITQPIAARQAEERDWISANTKLKTEATPAQAGGEYAMLNPWMCITEQEAIQNVNAARNRFVCRKVRRGFTLHAVVRCPTRL